MVHTFVVISSYVAKFAARLHKANEMAIGDCVLAKISKNDDQSADDNDINVND